ncbi:maestro heat-like repeat-containing protein family member 1 [Convolutriloba macropyga]|uniref:maestro heat-like repeat-containing protein family member 1 n=1 Tax=Convolutriloba macropyga TaxID=536237 RepID=UPI003F51D689
MTEPSGDKVLLGVINSLYTSCGDRSSEVQQNAKSSLVQLSSANAQTVLLSACNFLNNKGASAKPHQIAILEVLEKSSGKDQEQNVTSGLASKIVECSIAVMVNNKEVVPELQGAASAVLVALSSNHFENVWSELENKLDPAALPHYFTLKTLGTLATLHSQQSCLKLKRLFGLLLPMLGMVKQDNMKFVFATTLAEFCWAINDAASADSDKFADFKNEIQSEVLSCFDIIFNNWFAVKDQRVQLAVLEATTKICFLLPLEKLEENIAKIAQTIFNMLKKSKEQITLIIILGTFLEACVAQNSSGVEAIFDQVWNTLFIITCSLNETELATNKTFKELCKIYLTLNKKFDQKQLLTVMSRFDNREESHKIFALIILRHLINFDSEMMSTGDKKGVIVSGLKNILEDQSLKVRKNISQTILAIALQDFLSTEGSYPLIEFILINSASKTDYGAKSKKAKDQETVNQLQNDLVMSCQNVLNKLFTNISSLNFVLWPDCIQFLMLPKCHHAVHNLCSNLVLLIEGLIENGEEEIFSVDFEEHVNLPKPIEIFARLVVLSGNPASHSNSGINYMKLLQLLSEFFEEDVQKMWTKVIPKLVNYLEVQESENSFDQTAWEELLLKFFYRTLAIWDDEESFVELTEALIGQLNSFYQSLNDSQSKYFTYKCLGFVLRQSQSKKLVDKVVADILGTVDHLDQHQREGFAVGLGHAAATHLDQILDKLDCILKGKPLEEPKVPENQPQQTKKRFGLSSSSSSTPKQTVKQVDDKLKATVMLAYGNVCFYAPIDLITSRMEASILKSLNPHFASAKDLCLRQNVLRATELLAKSMHQDHLKQKYVFNNRNDIIKSLLTIIQSEPVAVLTTSTRQLGFVALAALAQLTPTLTDEQVENIETTCSQSIMTLPEDLTNQDKKKFGTLTDEEFSKLNAEAFESFNGLIRELTKLSTKFGQMFKVFGHIENDLLSTVTVEKHRALDSCSAIFKTFLENCETSEEAVSAEGLGQILARLLPLCNDENSEIRSTSLKCIECLYKITTQMKPTDEATKTSVWSVFDRIREPIETTENSFSQLNDLSKVVSFMVDVQEVLQYTLTLFGAISNSNINHSAAACIALNGIFKHRSDQFNHNISAIVSEFSSAMETVISNDKLKQGLLKAYKVFGVAHLNAVAQELLLSQSLPYSSSSRELIIGLCSVNSDVTTQVLRLFLDLLNTKQPYEEKGSTRVASRMVLAITLTFEVLTDVENIRDVTPSLFPQLFIALLANIGSLLKTENLKPASGAAKPATSTSRFRKKKTKPTADEKEADVSGQTTSLIVPRESASKALKSLLEILNNEESFIQECEIFQELLDQRDTVFEGVEKLADVICGHLSSYLPKIVPLAFNTLNSVYEDQRSCAVAFFGQLIYNKCGGQEEALVDSVMNILLAKLIDSCYEVRKIALESITNIANAGSDSVKRFSTPVLNALVMGLDDKDSPQNEITLISLKGLQKVLEVIDEPSVRSVLITICLRIKTCYEKDDFKVRCASFELFGSLTKFCSDESKSTFIDQILAILPTLLLHVNDDDETVQNACKNALQEVSALLNTPKFEQCCQNANKQNPAQFHYGEFLNNVAKSLIAEIPDKLSYFITSNVQFFKSSYSKLRANSALLVGFLIGNLADNQRQVVSIDHVLNSLTGLLKDPDVLVRSYTAESLGLLSNLIGSV